MDTHGHEQISRAPKALLKQAFSKMNGYESPLQRDELVAFQFGNWCTDLTQLWDEVAASGLHGNVKSALNDVLGWMKDLINRSKIEWGEELSRNMREGVHGFCEGDGELIKFACETGGEFAERLALLPAELQDRINSELDELQKFLEHFATEACLKVQWLLGPPGGIGEMSQGLRHLIRVVAFTKFCGPDNGRLDFDSFKAIFDNFFPPVTVGKPNEAPKVEEVGDFGAGFRGTYYPHQHLDRWPFAAKYESPDKRRNKSSKSKSNPETSDPGIFPYMRDCIEYVAGHLAELELCWAEPTFRPDYKGSFDTRPKSKVDKDWMVNNDKRLAQLGHALHVVEDFFAHSTFIEHALMMLDDAKSKHAFESQLTLIKRMGAKIGGRYGKEFAAKLDRAVKDGVPDRDFTRFQRRLLKLDPAWLESDDKNDLLNQTVSDAGTKLDPEPNVVTGFFDFRDTVLSIKHVLDEGAFKPIIQKLINSKIKDGVPDTPPGQPEPLVPEYTAAHGTSPLRTFRMICEWTGDPVKESFKLKSEKTAQFKKWADDVATDFEELGLFLKGDLQPFEVDEKVVEEIVGPFFPDWALEPGDSENKRQLKEEYKEIQEDLVIAFSLLKTGVSWKGHITTAIDALEWVSKIFSGPAAIKKLLLDTLAQWGLNNAVSGPVNFALQMGDDAFVDWVGANRIGCHSLIAKDHDYDYCADDAIKLAKAVDYYIVKTLLRWKDGVRSGHASKVAFDGPSAQGSEGRNTVGNLQPYVDWTELLEYFLRHPGGKTATTRQVVLPVTIVHIADGVNDTLASLEKKYRPSSVHPDSFSWRLIAEVNYGIHVPEQPGSQQQQAMREINGVLAHRAIGEPCNDPGGNYRWKKGVRIQIPFQKWTLDLRELDDPNKKDWFFYVLDMNWEVMRDGWSKNGWSKNKIPIHDHLVRKIPRTALEDLVLRGQEIAKTSVDKYRSQGREDFKKNVAN